MYKWSARNIWSDVFGTQHAKRLKCWQLVNFNYITLHTYASYEK